MEYLPYLRDAVVQPLKDFGADGVQEAITFMDSYCLMKEDIENIMEISTWGGKPSPFSKLDPKVKFTSELFPFLPYLLKRKPRIIAMVWMCCWKAEVSAAANE